jgi:integrase/recombinase XerD
MMAEKKNSNSVSDDEIDVAEWLPAAFRLPVHFPAVSFATPEDSIRRQISRAVEAWLLRSTSQATRTNYAMDLGQFLDFVAAPIDALEVLVGVRPEHVAAWRDDLAKRGLTNSSIRRKLTVLRSLFSYLRSYGYVGANPAHSDFVAAPQVPRDGKTIGLSPQDCRRLLDAPDVTTPVGARDRALLAVLAYSACRVGELVKLRSSDLKSHSGHRILEIRGKGDKERRVALHPEAVERLEAWMNTPGISSVQYTFLFPPTRSARGLGRDGFQSRPLTVRGVEKLVDRYAFWLHLDPAFTVHSLRVTALTTARERGCDVIDLQHFAGHSDPRTTLTYIRNRDRLAQSPAYVLKY